MTNVDSASFYTSTSSIRRGGWRILAHRGTKKQRLGQLSEGFPPNPTLPDSSICRFRPRSLRRRQRRLRGTLLQLVFWRRGARLAVVAAMAQASVADQKEYQVFSAGFS